MTVTIRYEIMNTYSAHSGDLWEVWSYNDATDGRRHWKTFRSEAAAKEWLHDHTETF